MKKRDRYKLISYAINEYNNAFGINHIRCDIKKSQLLSDIKSYTANTACEWSYCCLGLYTNCWQELYEEGNWDLCQKEVDSIIISYIKDNWKKIKKDKRVAVCRMNDCVHLVIILRDIIESDLLVSLKNNLE